MKNEHKEVILAHLKELKDLSQAQGEAIQKATDLISSQSELIHRLYEGLRYATESTGVMAERIVELQKDHQLVSLIKPVNSWMN